MNSECFLGRDLGAHEDGQMSRGLVQAIENRLTVLADLIDAVVVVENPVEACCGGVMLSPFEQKQRIGDLMLRMSSRVPSLVTICAVESLLPTKRLSTMYCSSSPRSRTKAPHHFSNSR